jgi:hypothetical protein
VGSADAQIAADQAAPNGEFKLELFGPNRATPKTTQGRPALYQDNQPM